MLTERPGLMVRLLANPAPTVRPVATAVRADLVESAALEPWLVKLVLPLTAGTLVRVARAATVLRAWTRRFYLHLVKTAVPVAMVVRVALAVQVLRLVRVVQAGTLVTAVRAERGSTDSQVPTVRFWLHPGPTVAMVKVPVPVVPVVPAA